MNKILISLITVITALSIISCDDKDKPTLTLSPSELFQTTWSGTDTAFEEGYESDTINFILEFNSTSSGTYIFVDENGNPYGNGSFKYQINGRILSFTGALVGDWSIIEKNDNRIILQAFLPQKHIIVLTKMY